MSAKVLFKILNEAAGESRLFRSQGIFSNLPVPVPGRYRVYEDGKWKVKNSMTGKVVWANGDWNVKNITTDIESMEDENEKNIKVIEKRVKGLLKSIRGAEKKRVSAKTALTSGKRCRFEEEDVETEEYLMESDDSESEEPKTVKRLRLN